jgi:hypothetical protein
VLHWIEIIGEAARGVSDKVRDAHPEVPWRVITDMRTETGGFATNGDSLSRRVAGFVRGK